MKEEVEPQNLIAAFSDFMSDKPSNIGFISPFQYIQSVQQMNRQKKCCVQKNYLESLRTSDLNTTKLPDRDKMNFPKVHRKEILAWIRQMSLQEKFKLFIIQDDILAVSIIKMYYAHYYRQINHYAKLSENSVNSFKFKQLLYEEIEKCFICRKTNQSQSWAEKELLSSLRIFDCVHFYDTICLSDLFLKDFNKVLKVFDQISGGCIFTSNCRVYWDQAEKSWSLDDPIWFNPNSFQTIASWIVSNIEKCIWIKYYNYQQTKYQKYNNENLEEQFCSLILENKFHLLQFWKNLDKKQRQQVFIESEADFREQFNFGKNKKRHKEPLVYSKFKDKFIQTDLSPTDIQDHFHKYLDNTQDVAFVEHIFYATIEQTTTVYPFIFRIILKKIQYKFTSELTDNLISKEEKKTQRKVIKKEKAKLKDNEQKLQKQFSNSTTDDDKQQGFQINNKKSNIQTDQNIYQLLSQSEEQHSNNNESTENEVIYKQDSNQQENQSMQYEKNDQQQQFIQVQYNQKNKRQYQEKKQFHKSSDYKHNKVGKENKSRQFNKNKENIQQKQQYQKQNIQKQYKQLLPEIKEIKLKKPQINSSKSDLEINQIPLQSYISFLSENTPERNEEQQQQSIVKEKFMRIVKEDKLFKKLSNLYLLRSAQEIQKKNNEKIKVISELRLLVLKRINFLLPKIFENNNIQLKVFGSCMTNLSLPDSDIDICLQGFRNLQFNYIPKFLDRFLSVIKSFHWVHQYQQIYNTAIPVLKLIIHPLVHFQDFDHHQLNKQIDFSFNNDNLEALNYKGFKTESIRIKLDISIDLMNYNFFQSNNHLGIMSTNFVNQQQTLYPQIGHLAIIIKIFLKSNMLNKSYTGGLSTYALVNIIIALIKQFNYNIETPLVTIFLRFIKFYSEFDFQQNQINVNLLFPIQNIPQSNLQNSEDSTQNIKQNNLKMINPVDINSQLSCFNFITIQNKLKVAAENIQIFYNQLKESIKSLEGHKIKELLLDDNDTLYTNYQNIWPQENLIHGIILNDNQLQD